MKITRTKTEELPLSEVGRLLNVDKEILAVFQENAAKVVFGSISYTSDGGKHFSDETSFATLSRTDLADGVETKVELTLGEVKEIVARAKKVSVENVVEEFDCKGTGDGDGSTVHTLIKFKCSAPHPAPAG